MVTRRTLFVVMALSAGCREPIEVDLSTIAEPRVLAVRAVPAEPEPGEEVVYEVLYADAEGDRDAAELDWSFCIARKPLDELGPVSERCLEEARSSDLVAMGTGSTVTAEVPEDACRLFGPERPPPVEGQPAGRPVDPDTTGGYYQPVRLTSDPLTLAATRLSCGLVGAPSEVIIEFNSRYRLNQNPEIARLRINGQDAEDGVVVSAGSQVDVGIEWASCDGAEEGCAGSERYVVLDPATRELVERNETLRVSWFTTRGAFALDHTGRSAEEAHVVSSSNTWVAPREAQTAWLYVVLRDDRGGVGWRKVRVDVRE